MSMRELIDKEVSSLPEPLQRKVYDFAKLLREKAEDDSFNGVLLSEPALDWDSLEEDEAWASL
jgi:hypothetical protein